MIRNYILNEKKEVVPEPDILKWGEWFEEKGHKKAVAYVESL